MALLNVLVPVKLDCFVLTSLQCDGPAKIAPITQPNYTYLRLYNNLIQHDILDHVDLHLTSPAALNSRLTDLGTGLPLKNRQGVYAHWSLPRLYRSATASTTSAADNGKFDQQKDNLNRGFPAPDQTSGPRDAQQPQFRPVPNRWMVIRHLDMDSVLPIEAKTHMSEFQAFVVESDWLRSVNDPGMDTKDLEVDVSPFVNVPDSPDGEDSINSQAEMFIGRKTPAETWSENQNAAAHSVKLTVMNSSNPLLADYQPHNSNVFSLIDNFPYTDDTSKFLEGATASYYVIGWHRDAGDDPFTTSGGAQPPLLQGRLSDCLMELQKTGVKDIDDSLKTYVEQNAVQGRALCHGAMYNVKYSTKTLPVNNKANDAATHIRTNQSIAVGGTALDGLLAFLREHDSRGDRKDLQTVESDILSIQSFLLSQEEDYDSQVAAQDMMYTQNFTKSEGGTHWHFQFTSDDAINTEPTIPTETQLQQLQELNSAQRSLDTADRAAKRLRWELFSEWWKYVSDRDQETRKGICAANVQKIMGDLTPLVTDKTGVIATLAGKIADLSTKIPCKSGTMDRYHSQKDPTLIIGGLESGWPTDFLDKLQVRLNSPGNPQLNKQVVTKVDPSLPGWGDISSFANGIKGKLPADIQDTAIQLFSEFCLLRPRPPPVKAATAPTPAATTPATAPATTPAGPPVASPAITITGTAPLYHDDAGRDDWQDTQPFFPVFIEWEAIYYHIPFEKWSLEERTRAKDGARIVQYGTDMDVSTIDPPVIRDVRTLSGRSTILPQPGYSLDKAIQNVFKGIPKSVLDPIISETERGNVSTNIGLLKFLSAPMSGLTSHLQTVVEGMHVKPNVRKQGSFVVPVGAAITAARDAGFDSDKLMAMGAETDVTPYSALVNFNQSPYEPFKPATHGQMIFTKINIIDKFGQAVCAIDPATKPRKDPPGTIYPCMSEIYAPGNLKDNAKPADDLPHPMVDPVPNTVTKETVTGSCRFVQMAPNINQDARLNSYFVIRDPESGAWRPVTEWENPIWGWLVVNYANYGLQVFLADGTFYREVRIGGASGATAGLKWLPFNPPTASTAPTSTPKTQAEAILQQSMRQLDFLITKLTTPGGSYMQAFFNMINQSILSTASSPTTYAEFLPSIVGKPLALVNTGFSLELAEHPFTGQSTLPNPSAIPMRKLLPSDTPPGPNSPGFYEFALKLGDKERAFDGLVGYFDVTNPGAPLDPKVSDFKLEKIYTYFTATDDFVPNPTSDPDPRTAISGDNFPKLHAYYIPPTDTTTTTTHESQLQVHGMIIDPFQPIHAYSAILPMVTLKLPPWRVQSAMKIMTAFFHMGPLVLTADIAGGAGYDIARELKSGYTLADENEMIKDKGTVNIPVVGAAEWSWLQPFAVDVNVATGAVVPPPAVVPASGGTGGTGGTTVPPVVTKKDTRFNAFSIGPVDSRPRLEKGPYTALEGYLQLRQPIVGPSLGGA